MKSETFEGGKCENIAKKGREIIDQDIMLNSQSREFHNFFTHLIVSATKLTGFREILCKCRLLFNLRHRNNIA